jgi:hypothetical protein
MTTGTATAATEGRNIQVAAWSVLLGAFAAFLVLLIGGPLWARHFLRTETVAQEATVESESGTISIRSGDGMQALDVTAAPRRVAEGWVVETFPDSRAFLDLSAEGDERLGPTVNVEPGTIVRIETMAGPRFRWGQSPRRITLAAQPGLSGSGGLTVGTTWDDARLAIDTPYARVELAPESSARIVFGLAAGSAALPLRVIGAEGTITVTNAAGQAVLGPDQRTDVQAGRAPASPATGPENIVHNSRFREDPLGNGWEFRRYYPDAPPTVGEARHEIRRGGRSVVHFRREGAEGTSADMYFRQSLGSETGTDISRARAISVTAELQVLGQSVPGGGARGTEYPLIVRLHTEDARGEQCDWAVGFYAVAPEPGSEYRTDTGVQVPLGEWHRFGSGNLLAPDNTLGFENHVPPCGRPAKLLWIEFSASGHDYDSLIDSLDVWVEPR